MINNAMWKVYFQTVLRLGVMLLEPVLSAVIYLKLLFWLRTGYWPNLSNPRSFDEKLQWLKLNDIHPEYARFVDKAIAKDVVTRIIGEKYVIPNLGVWNSVDDIDWEALPDQFVLKTTGDSGGVIVCKNKHEIDKKKAIGYLKKRGNRDYYKYTKEYPYKYVSHRYIAETYLEGDGGDLRDYKIFCFHGVPRFIQVDCNRFVHHERAVYDTQWNKIDLEIEFPMYEGEIARPSCLSEMLDVAAKLSTGIPHVRVDLYCVKNHVYFGEMTFFHGSGMERFRPIEWDFKFGELIHLKLGH